MKVSTPSNENEWQMYYQLRWDILRRPWGQSIGSERDSLEDKSIHAAVFENGEILGVGRLNMENGVGKIRFMATAENAQRRGIAKLIVKYLEQKAINLGVNKIQLNARETALPFYTKQGYSKVKKSHVLYNEIQHYEMEKVFS